MKRNFIAQEEEQTASHRWPGGRTKTKTGQGPKQQQQQQRGHTNNLIVQTLRLPHPTNELG